MDQPKNNRIAAAAAVAAPIRTPYTGPRDEGVGPVTGAETEAIRALDRRLTDGLNLVHGEIAEIRHDLREDRRKAQEAREVDLRARDADRKEAREAREADRKEAREAREADRKEAREAREADRRENRAEFRRLDARIDERTVELRREMMAGFEAVGQRLTGIETSIRELAVATGKALERGTWIRRLAWGLGGVLLLAAGAIARPPAERAINALFGG